MKKLFLVFVLLLAATAAVAATSDSSSSSATVAPAIRTYLMPDLSFKTVLSLDMLPQAAALASQPDATANGAAQVGILPVWLWYSMLHVRRLRRRSVPAVHYLLRAHRAEHRR